MLAILLIVINRLLVHLFTCTPDFNSLSRWNLRSLTDVIFFISSSPWSLWRQCMPLPFPDFSLCPASWTLSCCHFTLTSSSSFISDMSSIHLSRFSLHCSVFLVSTWCEAQVLLLIISIPMVLNIVFSIYVTQKVRYREWKGSVPGPIPVEHHMIVWLDPILHGLGLHLSPLFETYLLGNCVANSTWSYLPRICISACLMAGNG